jgi:hypothetical protein
MLGKVAGLARALAIILAVVAGFVAIPNLNVAMVLVVLGLIAGLGYSEETATRLVLTVLVLSLVGSALATIPGIGSQLGMVAANVAMAGAGAVATVLAIRLFDLVKNDLTGLAK